MADKKLTLTQIAYQAKSLGVETAALRAVHEVEAKGNGFLASGEPVILFERHIFYRKLREMDYPNLAKLFFARRPDLCNPSAGGYGKTGEQHNRLKQAQDLLLQVLPLLDPNKSSDKKIIEQVRACALMACSWGIGQVMGMNWESLGYPSLQQFINDMYESEGKQLEAMCRFIKVNGLVDEMQRHDWVTFARVYNGVAYRKNQYDTKLAKAYAKFAKG
nr:N-acetylmuramidase family protein [Moraxella osloensis]